RVAGERDEHQPQHAPPSHQLRHRPLVDGVDAVAVAGPPSLGPTDPDLARPGPGLPAAAQDHHQTLDRWLRLLWRLDRSTQVEPGRVLAPAPVHALDAQRDLELGLQGAQLAVDA